MNNDTKHEAQGLHIPMYGIDHSDPTRPGRILVYLDEAQAVIDQLREQLEWVKAINGALDESNKRCLEELAALKSAPVKHTDFTLRASNALKRGARQLLSLQPPQPSRRTRSRKMTDLLPCPFCGGEPNLTHNDYVHDDLRPMPVVECKSCSAWVRAEDWNTRAQPPSQGGEAVEVVAWQDAENPAYVTSEIRIMEEWVLDGYPIVPLCSMPKAQAVINQLRAELQSERDTESLTTAKLRERVAELEADLKLTSEMLVEVSRKGMALREALKSAPVVMPEELFDGNAVYALIEESHHRLRTSPENVGDTLDAVVRLIRLNRSKTNEQ